MLQDNISNSDGTSGTTSNDVQPLRGKLTVHVVSRDECLETVYHNLSETDASIPYRGRFRGQYFTVQEF